MKLITYDGEQIGILFPDNILLAKDQDALDLIMVFITDPTSDPRCAYVEISTLLGQKDVGNN